MIKGIDTMSCISQPFFDKTQNKNWREEGMFFFSPKISLLVVVALKDYDELEYREIIRACKEAKIKPVIAGPSRAACFGIAKEKLTPQVSIEEVNIPCTLR
eukprot:TRINITY_DN31050_c0_g1_i1.p4 TRINITY_DN31050_c0_g1~~TRINITY_DN31050_c0_g1_i1.p4  ORF type:complete len:101 (-),score=3.67 TRINITY_DN31050_c0_g1_i1:5-307(-)